MIKFRREEIGFIWDLNIYIYFTLYVTTVQLVLNSASLAVRAEIDSRQLSFLSPAFHQVQP